MRGILAFLSAASLFIVTSATGATVATNSRPLETDPSVATTFSTDASDGDGAVLSKVEDYGAAIFGWKDLPGWIITDVVFGVLDGQLKFAKYTAIAPGAAAATHDYTDKVDWLITDTLSLPEPVRFSTSQGELVTVKSFSFKMDGEGRAHLESFEGTYPDGEAFAYHSLSAASSGSGGSTGGPDFNGACGAPVVVGACDDYCWGPCIPNFAGSDPCHCSGYTGYCGVGGAVIACPVGTCTRVCLFTRPAGLCGCFVVPGVNVTGNGGQIPASGSGGGGVYPGSLPPSEFASTVNVPVQVMAICQIQIHNLNHTYIGDLQIVLYDPSGRGINLMSRPGYQSGGIGGNSGDILTGPYRFLEWGGQPAPDTANTNMNPGAYNQHYGDENTGGGGAPWPNGTNMIFNTGYSALQGPPGPWTLKIYDWESIDVGSCTGWTMIANENCNPLLSPPPVMYCTAKTNSLGCVPAIGSSGLASATSGTGFIVFGLNVRNNKSGLLFYGNSGPNAAPFQGGTLCVKAPIRRTAAQAALGDLAPANNCSGTYDIDMNTFALSPGPPVPAPFLSMPGAVVNCQWWGRDQGFPPPNNTTLTDGLEYTVGP